MLLILERISFDIELIDKVEGEGGAKKGDHDKDPLYFSHSISTLSMLKVFLVCFCLLSLNYFFDFVIV